MHYLAFSNVLGTMVLKLLQQLFHKLQRRLETVLCALEVLLHLFHDSFSSFWRTLVSWASRAIHQNLLHRIHLSVLSTAIYYTHFYYEVPSYLLFSAFHCHYLISGFLLRSSWFVSAKSDIPPWFAMSAYSSFPPLHLLSPVDSLKISFYLCRFTFCCVILLKYHWINTNVNHILKLLWCSVWCICSL